MKNLIRDFERFEMKWHHGMQALVAAGEHDQAWLESKIAQGAAIKAQIISEIETDISNLK